MRVFLIHGVNKRRELGHFFEGLPPSADGGWGGYEEEIQHIEEALKAQAAASGYKELTLYDVYWGDCGVRCNWYTQDEKATGKVRYRSLVQEPLCAVPLILFSRPVRSQGSGESEADEIDILAEKLERIAAIDGRPTTLGELLLKRPLPVLNSIVGADLTRERAHADRREEVLAAAARLAYRIEHEEELRRKLGETTTGPDADDKLLALLKREIARSEHGVAQGGIVGGALQRLIGRRFAAPLKSQKVYSDAARFFGDSVQYFRSRGTIEAPGPAILSVRERLKDFGWPTRDEGPVVFITHSLGGALFCDLFTHFNKDLHFDAWISVGGQLAFYEDLKLLINSPSNGASFHAREVEGVPRRVKLPLPAHAQWFNLYNLRDPIGFGAEAVFENVRDIHLTGDWPAHEVHNSYFEDPEFWNNVGQIFAQLGHRAMLDDPHGRFTAAQTRGEFDQLPRPR